MFKSNKLPGHESTDEQLMGFIGGGNRRAFELLYERYFNKLVWFGLSFIENRQKTEDAVQEVFIKIIENPGLFDTDRKFSTWIYTLTSNACKNIVRNEQNRFDLLKENTSLTNSHSASTDHFIDQQILKQRIKKGFNTLTEKEKNVFVLRFEQELSIKEIAGIMSIPEGSVKSCIYYLLKKLATHLKEFSHGK